MYTTNQQVGWPAGGQTYSQLLKRVTAHCQVGHAVVRCVAYTATNDVHMDLLASGIRPGLPLKLNVAALLPSMHPY